MQIRIRKIKNGFYRGLLLDICTPIVFDHKYEGAPELEFVEELFWHGYDLQVHAGPKFMIYRAKVFEMILF